MLDFELDKVQSFLVGTSATAEVLDCFDRIKSAVVLLGSAKNAHQWREERKNTK